MSVQQEERRGQDRRGQSAGHRNGRRSGDDQGQFSATKRDTHSQNPTPTDRYWSVVETIAPEE